jgi:uncharacterized protein DUF3572
VLTKGKSDPMRRATIDRNGAERIAVAALAFLAGDHGRLTRFLDVSGLAPARIRDAAGEPGFLAAVLDYFVDEDELIVGLAGNLQIRPEDVMEARRVLSPGEAPF